ncbi:MAG TPA: CstA-like transporter-associated (seleno)protein [Burkholderiaceae bacterium]|nr:CstA-like transporter-associated (seleno)protein [Burkholderiaceae bacterium]
MNKLRIAYDWAQRAARMMIGIPDYETYVQHRKTFHPNESIMSYEEFFFERQSVRYTVSRDRMRGCC